MGEDQKETASATRSGSLVKRAVLTLLIIVVGVLAYLAAWPAPIDPLRHEPPPALALEGALAPNERLKEAELLATGKMIGAEDVEVDSEGRIYGGTLDGRIVRLLTDGTTETFAETGGRPLGLEFDAQGNLIVADADKGLLSIDPQGNVTTLTNTAGGTPFGFTDDLDIARDGAIYFSDASDKFGKHDYLLDMLEGRPHGRLLRYDPATEKTEVLLDGLYFANGIALSQNEDFVLVNETYRFRITRYWLKGEKAGSSDVFIENLPGFPDGVSSNRRGTFWVALFTVRNETGNWLATRPFFSRVVSRLPRMFWPKPEPYGFVVALDEEGQVVESLHDPSGEHFSPVTSAEEREGFLYLGSLSADRIARYKLP